MPWRQFFANPEMIGLTSFILKAPGRDREFGSLPLTRKTALALSFAATVPEPASCLDPQSARNGRPPARADWRAGPERLLRRLHNLGHASDETDGDRDLMSQRIAISIDSCRLSSVIASTE
jgi:hypothetical protein